MKQLPLPEPIHGFKDDIQPRSVHFTPDGKAAIVSYLSHGIWYVISLSRSQEE